MTNVGAPEALPRDVGTRPERQRQLSRHEFDGSGSRETVTLPREARVMLARELQRRVDDARDRRDDEAPRLSTYDRILTSERGADLVARMDPESGEQLTYDDTLLAWAAVGDSILEETSFWRRRAGDADWVVGLDARLERFRTEVADAPLGRTVVGRAVTRVGEWVHGIVSSDRVSRFTGRGDRTDTHVLEDVPSLTSDTIQRRGLEAMPPDQVAERLLELNQMQVAMERAIGFDQIPRDGRRPGVGASTHRLHQAMHRRADAIVVREFGGRYGSFEALHAAEPGQAEIVRSQAQREVLVARSDTLAREVLLDEAPQANLAAIDAAIARIEHDGGGEALTFAREDLEDAQAELQERRDRLRQLRGTRSVDGSIAQLRTVEATQAPIVARLRAEVQALDDQINDPVIGLIAQLAAAPPRDRPVLQQRLATSQGQLRARQAEYDAANAPHEARVAAEAERAALSASGGGPGSIIESQGRVTAAQADVDSHSGQDSDLVAALTLWRSVAEPDVYRSLIDARWSQDHQGRYQRSRLADNTVGRDGQIVGAENIRRMIFEAADQAGGYGSASQQERGRRMLSDEAIARSIIEVFQVDIQEGAPPLSQLMADITPRRDRVRRREQALARLRGATPPNPVAIAAMEGRLRNSQTDLRTSQQALLLPLIGRLGQNSTHFDVADVVRFAIQEGLHSAAEGEPYLRVPGYYEAQEPERRMMAETILGPEMGVGSIEAPEPGEGMQTEWEGPLDHLRTGAGAPLVGLTLTPDDSLTFQIRTRFSGSRGGSFGSASGDRNRVDVVLSVSSESLVQVLPDVLPAGLPLAIRNAFYDQQTPPRLRARADASWWRELPEWISLPLGALQPGMPPGQIDARIAPADIIGLINNRVQYAAMVPEEERASGKNAAQTTVEMMHRSSEERQRIIRRFREVPVIVSGGVAAQVFMEGGDFWIGIPGTGRLPLRDFFTDERNAYERADAAGRATITDRLRRIYMNVGREILRSQVVH